MRILLHIFIIAGALLLIAQYVPGIAIVSFGTALLVALLWGIVGVTVRPILGLLTLPITILTLGLFSFILNALLFWLLSAFVPGFTVSGFIPALEATLILSVVSLVLHILLKKPKRSLEN
ncbi:phage holin family protein [Patescibacteria group bacterium]|nr:phage holin family protein [Patescibacteria group bacterium]